MIIVTRVRWYRPEVDAVQEALALWEQRERERAEFLLTLDDARPSLSRGENRVITPESMRQLAQDVKERGRARLPGRTHHARLMAYRLAPNAEHDLDDIWRYVAKDSGSIEIANRLIDAITDRIPVGSADVDRQKTNNLAVTTLPPEQKARGSNLLRRTILSTTYREISAEA